MITTLVLDEHAIERVLGKGYQNASQANILGYPVYLLDCIQKYAISTPLRLAHFLAQIGHESGEFKYMEELASGAAYEGRKDLGNTQRGDGKRFKGRGALQLTGRANYTRYFKYLGMPELLDHPEKVAETPFCIDVAGWFWRFGSRVDINSAADKDNVVLATRLINGGANGLQDRKRLLASCRTAVDQESARAVQEALNRSETVPELLVDGNFGPRTASVVREFQSLFFLKPTGVVDRATWATITSRGWA